MKRRTLVRHKAVATVACQVEHAGPWGVRVVGRPPIVSEAVEQDRPRRAFDRTLIPSSPLAPFSAPSGWPTSTLGLPWRPQR